MPTPKEVVTAVMTLESRDKKTVTENGAPIERVLLSYRCPKPTCAVKVVTFKEGSGFQNPYSHLRSCFGKRKSYAEQKEILDGMYRQARETMELFGGNVQQNFQASGLSEYERALYHYMSFIVLRRYHTSCVNDPDLRALSKFSCVIDQKTMRSVIMELVQLVEERIEEALNDKKGALLLDGWKENGTHYVVMLVSYGDVIKDVIDVKRDHQNVTRLAMIVAAPMAHVKEASEDKEKSDPSERGDENSDEPAIDQLTTSFNSTKHIALFRDKFSFFGQEFDIWCVCLIADNCNTNCRLE